MLRKEKEERYQAEVICIDELVPGDHLLRKIDKAVDFSAHLRNRRGFVLPR